MMSAMDLRWILRQNQSAMAPSLVHNSLFFTVNQRSSAGDLDIQIFQLTGSLLIFPAAQKYAIISPTVENAGLFGSQRDEFKCAGT